MASSLWPHIPLKKTFTWLGKSTVMSFLLTLGGVAPSVTLVGISLHLTACFKTLCRVTWMYWTVLGEQPESSFFL